MKKKLLIILFVLLSFVGVASSAGYYGGGSGILSYLDITKWWNPCNGYLKSDGTCSTEAGSIAANVPIVTDDLTATGGTISGTDITVGAGKTLNVSAGTFTVGTNQIDISKILGGAATADFATDLSTASHLIYKDVGGNITDLTLGNGLQDSSGTLLTFDDVVNFDWKGEADAAVAAGYQICKYVKLGSTITSYSSIMDLATNSEIALYKGAFNATVLPSAGMTGASNIIAANVLGIVGTNVTEWGTNTTITAGEVICANIISNDTAKKINLTLHGKR
ncbi:MAG: hypothetical protein WCY05_07215 [Candidatus Omnitrophota bacterium]